jgi:molecular chaperone DnaJ
MFSEATLGTRLEVPTLTGKTTIRIPPGTPSGKVFRLGGRGLKRMDRKGTGDLHIKIVVEVPTELDDANRAAIRELAKTLTSEAHPGRKEYDQAIISRK